MGNQKSYGLAYYRNGHSLDLYCETARRYRSLMVAL